MLTPHAVHVLVPRHNEHLASLERVAGRLTRVLGNESDDANRIIYTCTTSRWPVRLHGSSGTYAYSLERGQESKLTCVRLPEQECGG